MTAQEKLRNWISTFPDYDILAVLNVDYTDQIPNNGGLFPSGLVEVSRKQDILGNSEIANQYNFGLYCVFEKPPGDDAASTINADWVSAFQEWVQDQSARRLAPVFGDDPMTEKITAQNGMLYQAEAEGLATYMVQITVECTKRIEV